MEKRYGEASPAAIIDHYKGWVFPLVRINGDALASLSLRVYVPTTKASQSGRSISKSRRAELERLPSIPMPCKSASDIKEVDDHLLGALLSRPNPHQSGYDLLYLTSLFLDLIGRAYWYIVKNRLGEPLELWPLKAHLMEPKLGEGSNLISHYEYRLGSGQTKHFKPEEIVPFIYPSPSSMILGRGPAESAMLSILLDEAIAEHQLGFMENEGKPDVFLGVEGTLPKDREERIRSNWRKLFGRRRRESNVLIGQKGMEPKILTHTPQELDLVGSRESIENRLAFMFGVPVSMTTTKDVNRANAEAGREQHARNTIAPRCRRVEYGINQHLVPLHRQDIFVAFDNCIPADREQERQDLSQQLKDLVITVNEARARIGLDRVAWGDKPFAPISTMPISTEPPMSPGDKRFGEKIDCRPMTKASLRRSDPQPLLRLQQQIHDRPPAGLVQGLGKLFRKQGKVVVAALESQWPEKAIVTKRIDASILVDQAYWNDMFANAARGAMQSYWIQGWHAGEESIGITVDIPQERAARVAAQQSYKFAESIQSTTIGELRFVIGGAFEEGLTYRQVAKQLQELYEGWSTKRAQMIARTEIARASQAGTLEQWQESNVVEAKEWVATADACPFCLELERQSRENPVPLDTNFIDQGGALEVEVQEDGEAKRRTLTANYAAVPSAPAHPHCRCAMNAVLKEV